MDHKTETEINHSGVMVGGHSDKEAYCGPSYSPVLSLSPEPLPEDITELADEIIVKGRFDTYILEEVNLPGLTITWYRHKSLSLEEAIKQLIYGYAKL